MSQRDLTQRGKQTLMPVELKWHDPNQFILRCNLRGEWTTQAFCDAVLAAGRMARECAPRYYHTIIDASETNSVPPDFFSYAGFFTANTPPNIGVIAVVGAPAILMQVLRLMSPLLPTVRGRLRFVDTLDEAERLIRLAQIATGDEPTPANWQHLAG